MEKDFSSQVEKVAVRISDDVKEVGVTMLWLYRRLWKESKKRTSRAKDAKETQKGKTEEHCYVISAVRTSIL